MCAAIAFAFACGFGFAFFSSSCIAGGVLIIARADWLLASPSISGDVPLLWALGLWRSFDLTGHLRRPALASGAGSLAGFGPYLALGRVLATFALGLDSVAGLPLPRGAAMLNGSSVPHGHETV